MKPRGGTAAGGGAGGGPSAGASAGASADASAGASADASADPRGGRRAGGHGHEAAPADIGFDPAARPTPLDRPYDRLAALPPALWLPVVVTACGSPRRRLDDTAGWLRALDSGVAPAAALDFGDAEATAALRRVVVACGLPARARALPPLAEEVLRTLLWHLDRLVDLQPRRSRAQALAQVEAEFAAAWRQRTVGWEPDLALLRELADGRALTWDRLQGVLRGREWAAAQRAAARIAALPELQALLRRVGRREAAALPPRPAEPIATALPPPAQAGAVARAAAPTGAARSPPTRREPAPGAVTGVRFDAAIERMLPAEAMLLRHPLGRRLWHARRAEARLLTLATGAVADDGRRDPPPGSPVAADTAPTARPPLARGPMLLALDTSGSMRGAPEEIAKAVALAALRTARDEGRGLRLLSFGGAGEVLEQDLRGDGGFDALLALLGRSFDGGTDLQAPIEHAAARVAEAGWSDADLLLVSDGEFGCTAATLDRLDDARRAHGLQVHGVLVGDRETMGLLEVCDTLEWVRDWRRHAADGDPAAARAETRAARPVHSKSLTALYFPNALSPRAARAVARQSADSRRPTETPRGAPGS